MQCRHHPCPRSFFGFQNHQKFLFMYVFLPQSRHILHSSRAHQGRFSEGLDDDPRECRRPSRGTVGGCVAELAASLPCWVSIHSSSSLTSVFTSVFTSSTLCLFLGGGPSHEFLGSIPARKLARK